MGMPGDPMPVKDFQTGRPAPSAFIKRGIASDEHLISHNKNWFILGPSESQSITKQSAAGNRPVPGMIVAQYTFPPILISRIC